MPTSISIQLYGQNGGGPGFSTEIWREIALWLPPRDLRTLLLVPHVLSRIASQLLFTKVDLHFGQCGSYHIDLS